jgi:hypothetical protein
LRIAGIADFFCQSAIGNRQSAIGNRQSAIGCAMVQTCSKCSRANPEEAVYCYHDGFVLPGQGANGAGPLAVGSQVFHNPFVFPSGRTCRSFNELALACQEEWESARDLLQQGYLEKFFGGLGRVDLAQASRVAGRFPDRDRGLDQLLAKLPGDVLDDPRLRAYPLDINLGVVKVGSDHKINLHLENQGMHLLYGSVSCAEGVWLALGDPSGGSEKHFQFTHEMILPVYVRGDRLRASSKPLEARLLVESNGGTAEVVFRAEVPIQPFPSGVLAGGKTPRQVAELALAKPSAAAPLFENGEVQRWYKDNGWVYPVQGPVSSGMAAVQQYFEALGLTKPPKVELVQRSCTLQGNPGDTLTGSLEIRTQERRPVYAHAKSNQRWLEVGRAKLSGRCAIIDFTIPSVPRKPGEMIEAKVLIQSNGNQRFLVPVRVEVGESLDFAEPVFEVAEVAEVAPALKEGVASAPAAGAFAFDIPPPQEARPREVVPSRRPPSSSTVDIADALPSGSSRKASSVTRLSSRRRPAGLPLWVHLLPAALLLLALLGVAVWDLVAGKPGEGRGPQGENIWDYVLDDYEPLLGVRFNTAQRFGLVMLKERDPEDENRFKRLTREETGGTNNTCIRIDGAAFLFGKGPGHWQGRLLRDEIKRGNRKFYVSKKKMPQDEKILITQHVEIVPGVQSRRLDTCLVWYTLENIDTVPHKVGLRVMLDTFIGANDGVPFVIPGKPGLLDKKQEFGQKEIPDYIEAIENPDPENPGTVAHLGLKGVDLPGIPLDPITTMIICRWPNNSEIRWDLPVSDRQPIRRDQTDEGDSCVLLYWAEQPMQPQEKRYMAFTYGLGKISIGAADLGLTAGGSFKPGGEFTVTAYVKEPRENQKVTLNVPAGLVLGKDEERTKTVTHGGEYGQVSWRVSGEKVGKYSLSAQSGTSSARYQVRIKSSGIFGSD